MKNQRKTNGKWQKCYMLVKVTKNTLSIMPAINPDGTPTTPPPGFKWVACKSKSWSL